MAAKPEWLELLEAEEIAAQAETDEARKALEAAEDHWHQLANTRDVMTALFYQQPKPRSHHRKAANGPAPQAPRAGTASTEGKHTTSSRQRGGGRRTTGVPPRVPLEEAKNRILVFLASAGRPMNVREVTEGIGDHPAKGRIETTRGRLKILIREGRVIQTPGPQFTLEPSVRKVYEEGGAPFER